MVFERINYKPGIRRINSITTPDTSLNKEALELVNTIMNKLNEDLVIECLKTLRKKKMMKIEGAFKAVNTIFPGQLKQLALCEANKSLMKFTNGVIQYKAETLVHRRNRQRLKTAKLRVKDKIEKSFSKGVHTILHISVPEATITQKAKELLCELLDAFAHRIAEVSRATAGSQKVSSSDVRHAVEELLPEELKKNALAEGVKVLMLSQSFKPFVPTTRDRKRKKKETA